MNFGDNILKLRKSKNISQEQLAQKIGITRQTVSNWELNITTPNIEDLKKIAKSLDVSYDKLLSTKPKQEKNTTLITILKVLGILALINILILPIIFIIWKINYEKITPVSSYSLTCNYNENSYTYNVEYNKKDKIVKVTIEGYVENKEDNWIKELDKYIYSKEITDEFDLKEYIINKYEEHNGKCLTRT